MLEREAQEYCSSLDRLKIMGRDDNSWDGGADCWLGSRDKQINFLGQTPEFTLSRAAKNSYTRKEEAFKCGDVHVH
jgi:hypothetical protein